MPQATCSCPISFSDYGTAVSWLGEGDLTPLLCSAHSYVKRMKEFERERRLLQRKKRREQREAEMARGQGPSEVAPEMAL